MKIPPDAKSLNTLKTLTIILSHGNKPKQLASNFEDLQCVPLLALCFGCVTCRFTSLFSLSPTLFPAAASSCQQKIHKPNVHSLISTRRQADERIDWLRANI